MECIIEDISKYLSSNDIYNIISLSNNLYENYSDIFYGRRNIPTDINIPEFMMHKIKNIALNTSGFDITQIQTDIKRIYMTNSYTGSFVYHPNMKYLKFLAYNGKIPVDLNTLLNLNHLEKLIFGRDFSKVPSASYLKNLDLASTIETMTNLKFLKIGIPCKELGNISNLRKLQILVINQIDLFDFQLLQNLQNLFYLEIKKIENIINFDKISKLNNLKVLKLESSENLENLHLIGKLNNLRTLQIDVCNNPTKFIKNLVNLKCLKIKGKSYLDIHTITELYRLEKLEIACSIKNFNQIKNVDKLGELKIFTTDFNEPIPYIKNLQILHITSEIFDNFIEINESITTIRISSRNYKQDINLFKNFINLNSLSLNTRKNTSNIDLTETKLKNLIIIFEGKINSLPNTLTYIDITGCRKSVVTPMSFNNLNSNIIKKFKFKIQYQSDIDDIDMSNITHIDIYPKEDLDFSPIDENFEYIYFYSHYAKHLISNMHFSATKITKRKCMDYAYAPLSNVRCNIFKTSLKTPENIINDLKKNPFFKKLELY